STQERLAGRRSCGEARAALRSPAIPSSPRRAARSPSARAAPATRVRRARRLAPPGSGKSRVARSWHSSDLFLVCIYLTMKAYESFTATRTRSALPVFCARTHERIEGVESQLAVGLTGVGVPVVFPPVQQRALPQQRDQFGGEVLIGLWRFGMTEEN